MGKINQGILGGFSGKIGNVIGGNWKGIDYMRIKPSNVANPKTEGQLDQRSKFATVLYFLQPMKDFIKVGFKGYAIKMTEFNSAMSFNLNNAVTGSYPDYNIDYQTALLSRGSLASALNGSASSSAAGSISFSWDDNSDESNSFATDKAMILIYNADRKEAVFVTDGNTRASGSQDLTIPDSYSGDTVEAFIAFVSENGKSGSNSTYLGSVVVS
jgi:hypothetical protein